MPELPEVETVVRSLRRARITGRRIRSAHIFWPRTIAEPAPAVFLRQVRARRIGSVSRRGKMIRIDLDGGMSLLIHLRMTGCLEVSSSGQPQDRHERARLVLDDGRELRFHDPRKFGRWWLTREPDLRLARLGPEPFDRRLTPEEFLRRLRGHARQLKPLLLDQGFVAGIGNIYADESLWAAGLHPRRRSNEIRPAESAALLTALRRELRRAIHNAGTSLGAGESNFRDSERRSGRHRWALRVYHRTGQPCERCGTAIRHTVVGQRSTHTCPKCQSLRRRR